MTNLITYFLESGFDRYEAEEIAASFRRKTFAKGDYFIEEGQTARYLAFIARGLFQFYFLKEGNENTTYVVRENNFLASLSSFIRQIPSQENVRALSDAEIWQIHFNDLQHLKSNHQHFRTFYIRGAGAFVDLH